LYLLTKFEPNPRFLGEDMAFPKLKMAAVCHFGIVMTSFKTTHVEHLVVSVVREGFILINYSVFEDINFFIFLLNGLGLPNHVPFLRVFGNLTP